MKKMKLVVARGRVVGWKERDTGYLKDRGRAYKYIYAWEIKFNLNSINFSEFSDFFLKIQKKKKKLFCKR